MIAVKHILVTGGAGFIGSHTVALLLEKGYRVTVLDNLSSGSVSHLPITHPMLSFVQGDILDQALLVTLMKKMDAVLHLAAIASVGFSVENPVIAHRNNALGFITVLHAMQQTGVLRLVFASSAAVYGNTADLPCREEAAPFCEPLSPYALHKVDNERHAALYTKLHGLSILGLRYFNVYGKGQDPASPYAGVISRFLHDHALSKPLTVFGDGSQARDFISVLDIARANVAALERDYTGVLNIATGRPETLLNLIQYIGDATGETPIVHFKSARTFDIARSYASIERARDTLAWEATVPLSVGIAALCRA